MRFADFIINEYEDTKSKDIRKILRKDIVDSLAKITPKNCGTETKGTSIQVANGLEMLRLRLPKNLISKNRIVSW